MIDPLQCLLIDDDHDDNEMFQLAIERTKVPVECITVTSAIQALKILNDEDDLTPDFIFIDLNMPLMSGRECIIELKKIRKLKNSILIVYSTSSDKREVEEMLQLGASQFITKPTDINQLQEALYDCLQRKINLK